MIISHTHKYIFIKSEKTAGTSIEAALSQHCVESDVVTPLGDYRFNRDESGEWIHLSMNGAGFEQHEDAAAIKKKVSAAIWNSYFKFSIARNPWDRLVSDFFWRNRRNPIVVRKKYRQGDRGETNVDFERIKSYFKKFITSADWRTNDRFYAIDGAICVDYVMRYEDLSAGLEELRSNLGLHVEYVPRLKSGFRERRHHYSEYYDEECRKIVAEKHSVDMRFFGYTFENPCAVERTSLRSEASNFE